jgi:hypothetical protein
LTTADKSILSHSEIITMQVTSLHIGSSSVSLLIGEQEADGTITPVDFLEQPAPLAHDIFGRGVISPGTTERIVEIIEGFQKNLQELGLPPQALTRAVATNILSEAANCDAYLKTQGLIVRQVGSYKLPHCLRITVGDESSCRRIVHAVAQFKGQR